MNGMSRTAATLLGAAVAGFLIWLAAQFDRGTTGGYWAALGVVAGAGAVVGLTQVRGRRGNPRGMFLLVFLPVLVVAGWVLLTQQPHANWFQRHTLSTSGDLHVRGIVHDLGVYLGVLAFGIGLVFGLTLEPGARARREEDARTATVPPAVDTSSSREPTPVERAHLENERAEQEALAARERRAPSSPAAADADVAERERVAERDPETRTE